MRVCASLRPRVRVFLVCGMCVCVVPMCECGECADVYLVCVQMCGVVSVSVRVCVSARTVWVRVVCMWVYVWCVSRSVSVACG